MSVMSQAEREALVRQILKACLDRSGARKGAVFLLEPKAGQLMVRGQEGITPEDYVRFKIKADEPLVRRVEGGALALPSKDAGPDLDAYLSEAAADSMMLAPIVARGVVVGLLDVRNAARGKFGEKELQAAREAATHLASVAMTVPSIEAMLPPGEAPDPAPAPPVEEGSLSTAVMKTLRKSGAMPMPKAGETPAQAAAGDHPAAAVPAAAAPAAPATGRDTRARDERRKRPLLLPVELLREAAALAFRVLPVDFLHVGLCEEGIMAGYLVGPAAAAEGLQAPLLESVKAALGKEPLVPRDLEVVSEDAVVLDPVAVALSGKVTGAFTKAAPLPRMSVEAQTTLLVTAVQVDRLGFGEDAREILGDIASTLRHLFLQRLRTLDYRQGYLSLLNQILRPIEKTLPYMKSHSLAVANYAKQMALKMDLDEMLVENVIVAAILHDIGLLDIDFEILKSRASLSERDLHEIRKHPVFSREWVEQASFPYPVAPLVYAHHERWDGKGYPEGLRGDAIPLGARIIAVAEAFDAMTSRHSYKPPIAPAAALEEILAGAGTQFDPRVAEVFASVLRRPGKK